MWPFHLHVTFLICLGRLPRPHLISPFCIIMGHTHKQKPALPRRPRSIWSHPFTSELKLPLGSTSTKMYSPFIFLLKHRDFFYFYWNDSHFILLKIWYEKALSSSTSVDQSIIMNFNDNKIGFTTVK